VRGTRANHSRGGAHAPPSTQRPPQGITRALIPGLAFAYVLLYFGIEHGYLNLGAWANFAPSKSPAKVVEFPLVFFMSAVAASTFRRRWRNGRMRERGEQIRYLLTCYAAALALYVFMPTLLT
jgi:hypothetical protein